MQIFPQTQLFHVYFAIEISHNGTDWNPFGPFMRNGTSTSETGLNNSWNNMLNNTQFPNQSGYIQLQNSSSYKTYYAYHLADSTHEYKIRYKFYIDNSTSASLEDQQALDNLTWVTMDVPRDPDCEQEETQPVTLVGTQQTYG